MGNGSTSTVEGTTSVVMPSISELLASSNPDQFVATYTDIAVINLTCALGLPGSENLDIPEYLAVLDKMAEAAERQTERSWRLFDLKPEDFKNSKSVFRCLMLERVLRLQFKVRYAAHIAESQWLPSGDLNPNRPEHRDSGDTFINGILDSSRRTGTCSSMPVCCIAVGRRLGYPLKLVRVPNHCLYRWDDGVEVFNVQNTLRDAEIRSNESYQEPPLWRPTDFEINAKHKVWLHSMTPQQEVSKFLCNRAIALRTHHRYDEAFDAIAAARRFDPNNPACPSIWESINIMAQGGPNAPLFYSSDHLSAYQPMEMYIGNPAKIQLEPGPTILRNALNPFRDWTRDPNHFRVRVTTVTDDRHE